jgi:hypothetical protein
MKVFTPRDWRVTVRIDQTVDSLPAFCLRSESVSRHYE